MNEPTSIEDRLKLSKETTDWLDKQYEMLLVQLAGKSKSEIRANKTLSRLLDSIIGKACNELKNVKALKEEIARLAD